MSVRETYLIVLVAALLAGSASQAQTQVGFVPFTPAHDPAVRAYEAIWAEHGERILKALEVHTCLPFPEAEVSAVVADAISHSGGPEHPMRLRATYPREVKQSTLVHELGHRHLWQLAERLDDVDGHMTLYLVLDRVWADVWGEQFAENRVRDESRWDEDYQAAWAWARSLEPRERTRLWNRLLAMNGFADACESLARVTAGR